MASRFAIPLPHQRSEFESGIGSHRNRHRHSYAHPPASLSTTTSHHRVRSSVEQTAMTPPKKQLVCRLSNRKTKRVPVTSCDSCRLRKLKCNAKDMPLGATCNQCSKHGTRCTFDDRDEMQPPIKVRSALPQPTTVRARNPSHPQQQRRQGRESSASGGYPSPGRQGTATSHHSTEEQPPLHQDRREDARMMARSNSKSVDWGHEQAGLVLASIAPSYRPSPAGPALTPKGAIWDDWNVPTFLTDPDTGRHCSVTGEVVIELLLHRFYEQPSFNCIVVPNHAQMLSRLRYGSPAPLPKYLLHTMVACSCASHLTTEHELQLWQAQVWHGATESVHTRLNQTGVPELELVQALLLLSCNWPGPLLRIERINTFDTAVSLATSLQLHSGRHLDVAPGPRSSRISLFWSLYCADKIISVITKRSPAIPSEAHSVPLPSIEVIDAASGLPPKTAIAAWLQRLSFAFITLSQITESVQQHLILPIHHHQVTTLSQVFQRILPIEKRLENFCKEQRWLLGTVSDLSPLCRSLAEAVISQLHFTQLHLYLPALQFEVAQAGNIPGRMICFSKENEKPMAATIESAWHLVQQPVNGTAANLSTIAYAASITSPSSLLDQDSSLGFSHACVLIGMGFFRFLANHWTDWEGGSGCVRYATNRPQAEQQQQMESRSKQQSKQSKEERQQGEGETVAQCGSRIASTGTGVEQECRGYPVGYQGEGKASESQMQTPLQRKRPLSPLHIAPHQGEEDHGKDGLSNEAVRPDNESGKTVTFDTATLASFLVTTPARVLFQEQGGEGEGGKEGKESDRVNEEVTHSHAMLTPIRPEFFQGMQAEQAGLQSEGQKGGEVCQ